jgi:hypothetical protein
MTQDQNKPVIIGDNKPITLEDQAKALLTLDQYDNMIKYIKDGKPELALTTAQKFFELYLSGCPIEEIHRLNMAFPISAIAWAAIKYNWEAIKQEYIIGLQRKIAEKVMKTQLEATGLYCDLITAANKKYGDRVKKYLQTGEEQDLGDSLQIASLHQLVKAVAALQEVTGQNRNVNINKREQLDVNVNVGNKIDDGISSEGAAKILQVIADEKRKKEKKKK